MRVKFTSATGCPYGQLIIEVDTPLDRSILETFLWPSAKQDRQWKFGIQATSYVGSRSGPESFSVGWFKVKENKENDNGY